MLARTRRPISSFHPENVKKEGRCEVGTARGKSRSAGVCGHLFISVSALFRPLPPCLKITRNYPTALFCRPSRKIRERGIWEEKESVLSTASAPLFPNLVYVWSAPDACFQLQGATLMRRGDAFSLLIPLSYKMLQFFSSRRTSGDFLMLFLSFLFPQPSEPVVDDC